MIPLLFCLALAAPPDLPAEADYRAAVLGANDGIVSTASLVLGVAAAAACISVSWPAGDVSSDGAAVSGGT